MNYSLSSFIYIYLFIVTFSFFIISFFLDYEYFVIWEIVTINSVNFYIPFIFSWTNFLFRRIVCLIRINVMLFSKYYIFHEIFNYRFTFLVNIFICSMNILIFIPNMIILLIGWDGLGITSFLLVVYYQNIRCLSSGLITIFINRIGDGFILIRISLILNIGNWFFSFSINHLLLILSLLLLCCCTKRAQFPFSCWLPAAIAAPTPVRALVHSSTLVTAGIFLIIRFYSFFSLFPLLKFYIILVGRVTIVIAGLCAIVECNIKKIIALSTLRQLGVIIIRLGIGHPMLCYFHIIIHALFKALLFLCAGSLIFMLNHSQDLRFIGNISNQLPLTISCIIISNMSLCGFPFIRGFYSKDLVIEYRFFGILNCSVYYTYILGAILTFLYSLRFLLYCSFIKDIYMPINTLIDKRSTNLVPIFILSLFSVFSGGLINWFIFPFIECFMSFYIKNILLVIIIRLFFLYLSFYNFIVILWDKLIFVINLLRSILYLNYISGQIIIFYFIRFCRRIFISLDAGWLEFIGPKGLYSLIISSSNELFSLQLKTFISNILLIIIFFVFITFY